MREASPRALAPSAQKDSKKILTFSNLTCLIFCKLDFQLTNGDLTINTLIDYLKNYLELDLTDAQFEELARAISKNPALVETLLNP